ncbi:MAG: glycerophosphodiester phosphodiesterase, partial [Oscillospiraceae bacterium]|nr:glycerophosphodiester phosphodiesterase [Oscillospiraceae bacterium]
TRDKKVVVFHDSDLARTSSIDQKILDIDYNQLKQIKVYGREEIPLLEDVLAVLDKNLPIVVEIKSEGGREWVNEICRLTYEILRGYDGIYCVESFDPLAVAWFKKADPSIIRGQLSMAATGYKGTTNPFTGFLLHSLLLNLISRPHFIAYQHEDNCLALMILKLLRVMIFRWTIKNQQRHNELLAISDGLIFEGYTPESRW